MMVVFDIVTIMTIVALYYWCWPSIVIDVVFIDPLLFYANLLVIY